MGKTLEDVFKSEFRQEIANTGYKNIYKVPLPDVCKKWEVSGTDLYAVKGISVPVYKDLNRTIVKRLPSNVVAKRRKIDKQTRGFAKDSEGNFVYEDFVVPSGSMAVVSSKKIGVTYKDYKAKVSKDGYGYIDFVSTNGKTEYMYVIPKSVLYKVNQTALALSVKNMKNYQGSGYTTWDMGVIFLHIIPYKPNAKYEGSIILKTGTSLNYNNEVATLIKFWEDIGVIPNIALCALNDGTNLVTRGTTVGYDTYSPVDSLAISDKEIYGSEENDVS